MKDQSTLPLDIQIVASATIEHGTTSNRIAVYAGDEASMSKSVRSIRRRARDASEAEPEAESEAATPAPVAPLKRSRSTGAPGGFRKDMTTRGRPYKKIGISMPGDELDALDAFAARVQMARSDLIRQSVKHLRAFLKEQGDRHARRGRVPFELACVSIPLDELVAMDADAKDAAISRSELIRQAVKHFEVKVLGEVVAAPAKRRAP